MSGAAATTPGVERDPLTFATMQPIDIRAVVALERRAFADPWPASLFRKELGLPQSRIVLALSPTGEIVGYVCRWITADHAEIQNVAVDPRWRRRGVARSLLELVLDEARQAAVGQVLLEVRSGNEPAIALYQALGFETNGRRRRYYDDGEDALLMELRLDRDRG